MPYNFAKLMAIACGALLLCACARAPESSARQMPQTYQISVAPLIQPLQPGQLITGHIPEDQGKIPQDELEALDIKLRDALLGNTDRTYNFIPPHNLPPDWSSARSQGQPGALERWLAYGRAHKLQYLLIPQVLDWHEREGSDAGVTSSAHVRMEFYLVDVDAGTVVGRSIYEEKQVGLVDNLLSVGDFVKRGAKWVTAADLATEGMRKAIQDLGL